MENICNMKKMGAISFIGLAVIGKEPYYFLPPYIFPYFLHMKRKGKNCKKLGYILILEPDVW